MTSPTLRAGRQAGPVPTSPRAVHAPHAALLIDFDNVTLGIRSDLTKELKTLLNSDIIRGKVAVQRAYADWRRYPQYIVPLSERSIDLIFATAVGSTKKNATDIRLAIDAIELVFTRPEIGTFILLSGDSDFSSLVIKLKEYGKYVIGVGIRESASDLLIQNCDEYYSYSELAGLHKEIDTPSAQRDPWELVREAVSQMARQDDVMRSDRLKQVMQQIDPNFDERNAGFNRFSKFVTEAAAKGLVKLAKLDNGQFEVSPLDGAPAPAPASRESDDGRPRGRSRRGGRDRDRDRPDRDRSRNGGRKPDAGKPKAAEPAKAERSRSGPARTEPAESEKLTLGAAFSLMGRALEELGKPVAGEPLRARMAALHGREDPLLDATRFGRLLRQANDAEVADVRKVADDEYEIALPRGRARAIAAAVPNALTGPPPAEPVRTLDVTTPVRPPADRSPPAGSDAGAGRASTLRFRRGSRGGTRKAGDVTLVGAVDVEPAPALAPPAAVAKAEAKPKPKRTRRSPAKAKAAPSTEAGPAEPSGPAAAAPVEKPKRTRRGRGKAPTS